MGSPGCSGQCEVADRPGQHATWVGVGVPLATHEDTGTSVIGVDQGARFVDVLGVPGIEEAPEELGEDSGWNRSCGGPRPSDMRRLSRLPRALSAVACVLALGGCGLLPGATGDGPGSRTAFVELGPLVLRPDLDLRSTQLGPEGNAGRLYAALEAGGAKNLPRAKTALEAKPPKGDVGLAIVMGGCQNTGARLEIDGRRVSADLTGAENINCAQAEYFLATFEIPEGDLPDNWTLHRTP